MNVLDKMVAFHERYQLLESTSKFKSDAKKIAAGESSIHMAGRNYGSKKKIIKSKFKCYFFFVYSF